LASRLREEDLDALVVAVCKRVPAKRCIIFYRSKISAHRARVILGLCGLRAGELHGNLTQQQRLEAVESFRNGDVDYLVCTDLAARGLDIPDVDMVINARVPNSLKQVCVCVCAVVVFSCVCRLQDI
jgi:ATP-dependent RNA helicase DDX27